MEKFLLDGKTNLEIGLEIQKLFTHNKSMLEAWYCLNNNIEKFSCKTCGKSTNFDYANRKYSDFCSLSCAMKNKEVIKKREKTNLERHGYEKVGIFCSPHFKNALKEKYNVSHPMLSEEIKTKLKQTNLQKYGVENVFAAKVEKIKETFKNKYGENITSSIHLSFVKEKFRDKDNNWIPAITNVEKRKINTFNTIKEKIIKRLKENNFELLQSDIAFGFKNKHLVKHLICGNEFSTILYSGMIPRCLICNPLLNGTSYLQKQLKEFLLSKNIKIEVRRRLPNKKEIDIFIPSKNLGIEINGLYWDSELAGKDKNYHLQKLNYAQTQNIRLIHLFEDDIVQHWDAVKSLIMTILNKNEKIGARKCILSKIENKTIVTEFLEKYHIRGSAKFSSAFGLFYKNELVSCATFNKPRYSKVADWELIRFCSKENLTIVGGLSKIINTFKQQYNPKVLISYADRCYSNGNMYLKTGFKQNRILPPNYWYFNKKYKTTSNTISKI